MSSSARGRLDGLRVVVAGGGVVGLAAALELAREGAGVTLVDPDAGAPNASAVAAGMLALAFETVFDDGGDAQLDLLMEARDLWPAFASACGVRIERPGSMALGSSDEADAWFAGLREHGLSAERLTSNQLQARAPMIAPGVAAVWTNEDWRIEPAPALSALRRALAGAGGRIVTGVVEGFRSGRVHLAHGDAMACEALVIATGASRSLLGLAPELGSLAPIKGHILQAPALDLSGPVLRFAGGYICPADGGALVGASMEEGRADSTVDPVIVARLRSRAGDFVPALARAAVTARTGVRASAPDALPLVGAAEAAGVWLAVGARRNGWLLAPLIARTLVDAMAGEFGGAWTEALEPARLRRP